MGKNVEILLLVFWFFFWTSLILYLESVLGVKLYVLDFFVVISFLPLKIFLFEEFYFLSDMETLFPFITHLRRQCISSFRFRVFTRQWRGLNCRLFWCLLGERRVGFCGWIIRIPDCIVQIIVFLVEKKLSGMCFHIHAEAASQWSHADHVRKTPYRASQQAPRKLYNTKNCRPQQSHVESLNAPHTHKEPKPIQPLLWVCGFFGEAVFGKVL